MFRHLASASAIAVALAMAAPASAQNYGYGQQQQQQYPTQYNRDGQNSGAYGQQGYGRDQSQQGQQQRYDNRGAAQPYGSQQYGAQGSTQGSAYSNDERREMNRNDRRQSRDQSRRSDQELAVDVETALQAHGYKVGAVDGTIDSESRAAIRSYQRDASLPVTGKPSQDLLAHIEANNVRAGGGGIGTAAGDAINGFIGRQFGGQTQ